MRKFLIICCWAAEEFTSRTATAGMAGPYYSDIVNFGHPAYSYIIKLRLEEFEDIEQGFYTLCGGLQWSHLQRLHAIENNYNEHAADNYEHSHILEEFAPGDGYMHALCWAAYRSALDFFKQKQSTMDPKCSVFCQSELGSRGLVHVHLLMSGYGLHQKNAKISRLGLCCAFFRHLMIIIKERLNYETDLNNMEQIAWSELRNMSLRLQAGNEDEFITILQKRGRNGTLQALPVNATSYIVRYFLPKNRRFLKSLNAASCTLLEEYNPSYSKTYGYTIINGKTLEERGRRLLYERCCDMLEDHPVTEVLVADMWERLPKVDANRIDERDAEKQAAPIKLNKLQRISLDVMRRCNQDFIFTYESFVEKCPELLVLLESSGNGRKIFENILNMIHTRFCQHYTAYSFMEARNITAAFNNDSLVCKLLNIQQYNCWQVGHWIATLLKHQSGKQNTLSCFGPASTGKTNFVKAIAHAVGLYGSVNHNNIQFPFNDCSKKLLVWWEEAQINSDNVEAAKCILGGTPVRIDVKHQGSTEMPRTPVLISTNNNIYAVQGKNAILGVHEMPLRQRIVQLNFMQQLPPDFGEIQTHEIVSWLKECASRYDCSLSGFLSTWNLQHVPNSFPIQSLCENHSQSFIFHEHGLCAQCGGYVQPVEDDADGDDSSNSSDDDIDGESVNSGDSGNESPFDLEGEDAGGFSYDPSINSNSEWPDFTDIIEGLTVPEILTLSAYCTSTDLSLEEDIQPATPQGSAENHASRADSEEDGESEKENQPPAPKKARLETVSHGEDEWSAQPVTEGDEILWKASFEQRQRERQRQQTQSPSLLDEKPGCSSWENSALRAWGEKLGVYTQGPETEPVVLHCFETMEEET